MLINDKPVDSPCIRNCCLNPDDICLGCFRSLEEICQWSKVGDSMREEYLKNADIRRKKIQLGASQEDY